MDEELRGLERAWERDGSILALRSLLQALTRAGLRSRVMSLLRDEAGERLGALGGAPLVDLVASPRYFRIAGEIKGFEQRLRAWRFPPELGGLVLVDGLVSYGKRVLIEVGPASRLVLTHYAVGGVVSGEESELSVDDREVFAVDHPEGDPVFESTLEAALRGLAAAAGATLEVTHSLKFCD